MINSWKYAKDLSKYDKIFTRNGLIQFHSSEKINDNIMYDIEVLSNEHRYWSNNILEKYSDFVFESNVDEILNIVKNQMKEDKTGKTVETPDFILKIDDMTNHLTLSWVYTKTRTYSGTDILRALIKYSQEKNYKFIAGYGIKGFDIISIEGKKTRIETNGYYSLMRWGFLPDKGVKLINKKLKTTYTTLEDAFNDSSFWNMWKDKGDDYTGEFDLSPNSLSFKVLDKQL